MSEEEDKENEEDEENEEKEENEENEDKEDNEGNEEEDEKEEKEENENEDEEKKEKEDEENEQPKKEIKKDKKEKGINKFLDSKLHQSTEIKIDLKGSSNSSAIFGNNINNYSILTAAFPIRSSLQILTDINNDMDLLSNKINKNIIPKYSINSYKYKPENTSYFSPMMNNFYSNGYNSNINYDKEDLEIKQLINKANNLINNYNRNDNAIYKYSKTNFNSFSENNNKYFNSYHHDLSDNNNYGSYTSRDYNFNSIRNFGHHYRKNKRKKPYHNNYYIDRHYENYQDIDSEYYNEPIDREEEFYLNNRRRNNTHYNISNRKFPVNNNRRRKYNNNVMSNTLQNINHKNNPNHYYNKESFKNNENFYQKTFTPRKKLSIYTQTDSLPIRNNYINGREIYRNFSVENNYENNKRYDNYGNRDNIKINKNLRFNTEGPNRPIDTILGND